LKRFARPIGTGQSLVRKELFEKFRDFRCVWEWIPTLESLRIVMV